MTMKISLLDINRINTMILDNIAKKIWWLINSRPYKTISQVKPPPQKKKKKKYWDSL